MRARRKELGLSVSELCARLENEISDYPEIERGAVRPRAEQLIYLSEILGVPRVVFFETRLDRAAPASLVALSYSDSE